MTTEFTASNNAAALFLAKELVEIPFTRADALRLLSDDGTSCTIPDTFTSIVYRAFANADDDGVVTGEFSLLETIVIPDSIASIGSYAFYYCKALKTINLPNTLTSIGGWAFASCSALSSINLPDSITRIYWGAFSHCSALSSIVLPKSIEVIAWETFRECSSLVSVTIPDSLTKIQSYAFIRCSSLKSIIVSDAVLNNSNYGMFYGNMSMSLCHGTFYDPFEGCTELMAMRAALNVGVKGIKFNFSAREYLLHQNKVNRERITRRAAVIFCLKTINADRMLAREGGRTFSWEEDKTLLENTSSSTTLGLGWAGCGYFYNFIVSTNIHCF